MTGKDPRLPSTPQEQSETDKFRRLYAKVVPPSNPPPADHDDTGKYLVAILGSLVIGILGWIGVLWIRPEYDPLMVAGVLFAFLTPTTTSLLSFMKSSETKKLAKETKVQAVETHLVVNSRLDSFIKQAQALARAEGLKEGEATGAAKANVRTDELKRQSDEKEKTDE